MPRYFFNVLEGDSKNIVRDFEGRVFSSLQEARKEGLDFARDIVKHGFRGPKEKWKLVVTDENAVQVLTIPLSQVRACKVRVITELRRRFAGFDARFRQRALSCLLAAALIVIIVQATLRREIPDKESSGYRTASLPSRGTILSVRFAPQASVADMTEFLDYYNASLVGGPRPAGFYSVQIDGVNMPKEAVSRLLTRMAGERVVEFASAVQ